MFAIINKHETNTPLFEITNNSRENNMLRQRINWKKLISPSDSVAIVVVIVGLLIAIFLDEIAIRIIGVCVALLGGVALAMLISQRMAEIVDTRYKPSQPPPNYKITVKKESGAKRQTFEDFAKHTQSAEASESVLQDSTRDTSEDLKKIVKTHEDAPPKKLEADSGESIRIIDKRAISQPELQTEVPAPIENKVKLEFEDGYEFSDGDSGIRIVGKVKTKKPEQVSQPIDFSATEVEVRQEKEPVSAVDTSVPDEKTTIADSKDDKKTITEASKEAETKPSVEQSEVSGIKADFQKKHLDLPMSSIIETEFLGGQEPRKEFEYFLNSVLKVIRSITNTRTSAFLLLNNEKKQLILQSFDTQNPEAITPKLKLPIRDDIISQIARNQKPEILTEINPAVELDLIPYYTRPVGTGSFVGVPVFYNNTLIGILCADSSAPDAYEAFTVGFLGQFTKLIGTLVNTYTEKYELLQASKTLKAIDVFNDIINSDNIQLDDIYKTILSSAQQIFDYTTIGICGYNHAKETWNITGILSKNEPEQRLEGHEIKIKSTYVGESILAKKTIYISPMIDRGMMYHPKETKYPSGFFVAVPLKSTKSIYGSLFVVGKSQSNITSYDVQILEILANNAGNIIEHFVFMHMLKYNAMTETGGILNEGAFVGRLEEEMNKAIELGNILALALFTVDKIPNIDSDKSPEKFTRIANHVFEIIKKHLKSYYPFGKVTDDKYSIILTGMKGPVAQRWAEKIRTEIARTPVEIDNKRYFATISMGIAELLKGETIDDLALNANKALQRAREKGNKICVFE